MAGVDVCGVATGFALPSDGVQTVLDNDPAGKVAFRVEADARLSANVRTGSTLGVEDLVG